MQSDKPDLVKNEAQITENIRRYNDLVEQGADVLIDVMSNVRAWYAMPVRDPSGRQHWLFGPSKFVGYTQLDAETYRRLRDARQIDGGDTEKNMRRLFPPVAPSEPLFHDLHGALSAFLARFGKAPQKGSRITAVQRPTAEQRLKTDT